jgi:hypothetical protein
MQIKQIISLALLPLSLFASDKKESSSTSYDIYSDNTGTTINSPSFNIKQKISKIFIDFTQRIDAITSASIRNSAAPARPDAITSASPRNGYDDLRMATTLSGTYSTQERDYTLGGYYSNEKDYTGRSIFASYGEDFNLQNSHVGLSFSHSSDLWSPSIARVLSRDDRKNSELTLSLTQLLSPKHLIGFGYSVSQANGFLGSPYLYLYSNNITTFERLPESKYTAGFNLKGIHQLSDNLALHWQYNYADNDWGNVAHTVDINSYYEVSKTNLLALHYRYYTQSAAFFETAPERYTPSSAYIMVDYRYGAYSTNTFGISDIHKLSETLTLKLSIDKYQTSDHHLIKLWNETPNIEALFGSFSLSYAH